MKRQIISVVIFIIFAFLAVNMISPLCVNATSDTAPPQLISCIPSKTSYVSGEDVIFELKMWDESGIDNYYTFIQLYNTDRSDSFSVTLKDGTDVTSAEDLAENIYTFRYNITVNDNFDSGNYKVGNIFLTDLSGNRASLYEEGDITQCSIYVENTVRTDFEGPEIVSFDMNKTSIVAGENIEFTIHASDVAGVHHAYVTYIDNNGTYGNTWLSQVGDNNSLWKGSFTSNAYTLEGNYYIQFIDIWDQLGNVSRREVKGQKFYISNPNYNPGIPSLERVVFSKDNIKPGEKVTIEVDVNPNGAELNDDMCISLSQNNSIYICDFMLYRQTSGEYLYEWTVPANLQPGSYDLCITFQEKNGTWHGFSNNSCDYYVLPKLIISSIFSGLDNRSILTGTSFDPLAGVSASNETQGDVTSKIEIQGRLDTNQPGLYLLRYKIKSNQTINYTIPIYYYESRWIGVTELIPEENDPNAPLSLTNDTLQIGAQPSDVSLKRDGQIISFENSYTVPGIYAVSENSTNTTQNSTDISLQSENTMQTLSAKYESKSTVTAVIDKSEPAVKPTWSRNAAGDVTVAANASDVSGIAEMKYMSGECSIAEIKSGGTVFTKTFTVPTYGKYTIYAKDKLGNEGISIVAVTSAMPSSYLYNVKLIGGSLSRTFSKDVYSYKIPLTENQGSVVITPIKDYDGAKMTIEGQSCASYTVNVDNNKTKTVTVKVSFGGKTRAYTFVVTRAASTKNNLTSLTADHGTFDSSLTPDKTNYTLTLDKNTKSVKISAAAAQYATQSFKSKTATLKNGETRIITLTVKAQSGAKKVYTITVKRAESTDNSLKSLRTSTGSFVLSPGFKPEKLNYTITMPANKSSFTLYAAPAGYKASVTIDGVKRTSKKITLASVQSTSVRVIVTAQSGATREYVITVNRP